MDMSSYDRERLVLERLLATLSSDSPARELITSGLETTIYNATVVAELESDRRKLENALSELEENSPARQAIITALNALRESSSHQGSTVKERSATGSDSKVGRARKTFEGLKNLSPRASKSLAKFALPFGVALGFFLIDGHELIRALFTFSDLVEAVSFFFDLSPALLTGIRIAALLIGSAVLCAIFAGFAPKPLGELVAFAAASFLFLLFAVTLNVVVKLSQVFAVDGEGWLKELLIDVPYESGLFWISLALVAVRASRFIAAHSDGLRTKTIWSIAGLSVLMIVGVGLLNSRATPLSDWFLLVAFSGAVLAAAFFAKSTRFTPLAALIPFSATYLWEAVDIAAFFAIAICYWAIWECSLLSPSKNHSDAFHVENREVGGSQNRRWVSATRTFFTYWEPKSEKIKRWRSARTRPDELSYRPNFKGFGQVIRGETLRDLARQRAYLGVLTFLILIISSAFIFLSQTAIVPNVVDQQRSAATAKLEESGFKPSVSIAISENFTYLDAIDGPVSAQSPIAGSRVRKGSEISLTIAERTTHSFALKIFVPILSIEDAPPLYLRDFTLCRNVYVEAGMTIGVFSDDGMMLGSGVFEAGRKVAQQRVVNEFAPLPFGGLPYCYFEAEISEIRPSDFYTLRALGEVDDVRFMRTALDRRSHEQLHRQEYRWIAYVS